MKNMTAKTVREANAPNETAESGVSQLQAVVSLPWRMDQDNDKGLCVVDARGEIVYVEDWGGIPDEMSSGMREQIIEQARANARFMVAASEFAAALEAAREDAERWRALREMDGGEIYALLGDCDGIHPEQADAAIDQARGEGVA